VESARALPLLEHGFTHFRLKVRPILATVRNARLPDRRSGRRWVGIRQAERGAVPVPVRTLLRNLPTSRE
jgi:A/G-specific adenine glycosylase